MQRSLGGFRHLHVVLALAALIASTSTYSQAAPGSATPAKHPLTIDDVLETVPIDRGTLSPDGAWIAAVVPRPVRTGEVYGRNSYETDPSHSDIWLISTKTGERRALTHGLSRAAGYWCATWSPDGQRLALLSTAPEGQEPRGGDNVRLYVWERASGALRRMSADAVMTQTRYGWAIDKLDLSGGADHSTIAHRCGEGNENAPFLWLDNRRLLAAMLPHGGISSVIDQSDRPYRSTAHDAARLRDGVAATASVVESGGAAPTRDENSSRAILRTIDVGARLAKTVATVPIYPFRSSLSVSVSPDGKRLALLATLGALPPQADRRFPNPWDDNWSVERRFGFADLVANSGIRWVAMPVAGRYPLQLYGWSPNSRSVALRARADPFATATPLFVADASLGIARQIGPASIDESAVGSGRAFPPAALWANDGQLIAHSQADQKTPATWWLLDVGGGVGGGGGGVDLGRTTTVMPESFARAGDGSLFALVGKSMLRLDPAKARLVPVMQLTGEASIVLPDDAGKPTDRFLIVNRGEKSATFEVLDASTGRTGPSIPAFAADLIDMNLDKGILLYKQADRSGLFLRQVNLANGQIRDVLALDTFMARVDWGQTRLIDYRSADGQALKGAVILPPDYRPDRRYPTLVWVYAGYRVGSLDNDFFLNPYAPGFYNLQLYAAKGFVVLVPSMPLSDPRRDIYAQIPKGVMPAIDRLVELGIADPDRLGVFGQSFGGYSVYALIGQTDRFKAAVAMAGLTDLSSLYGEFDPSARGYPGIEHQKNDNWASIDQFGQTGPPWQDPANYARNSPLTYVDRVRTPLLLIHGDADIRGPQTQAEQFFYGLYMQGKAAKLLRYGGEDHGLRRSPANVRDILIRTEEWFDRYLKAPNATAAGSND